MADAEGVLVSGASSEAGLGMFFQVGAVLHWGLTGKGPPRLQEVVQPVLCPV